MEILDGLATGFAVALSPMNLLYVTVGVVVGTVIGLLPGLGPVTAIALLLPLTFSLEPATAIIMLAGIYYGAMYGGRIPSILLKLPGDASSVMTTLDGYPLAQQGRAGVALGITAIGSFVGGTIAIIGLTILAPSVARIAGQVGAPEMFMLTLVGIVMIGFLGSGSKAKALALAGCGLLVAAIGLDPVSGAPRLTFGSQNLAGGINIVPVAVGLFGLGEILYNSEKRFFASFEGSKVGRVLPSAAEWAQTRWSMVRASVIGFIIGVLPGGGGVVSSVLAYGVEKRVSKQPELFGKGALDGLTATETADNASSNSAFIPLLTLGIPPNPVLAVIFGALLIQNVTPGPNLVNSHPEIFWGVIASMYIGNIMLLVLNLPLVNVFVQILRVPGGILSPVVAMIAIVGVYSVANSLFDVSMAILFGLVGYLLRKWQFDLGPFVLAFVLGPIMEVQFRRAMTISDGSFAIFFERPGSLAIFIGLTLFIGMSALGALRARPPFGRMRMPMDTTGAPGTAATTAVPKLRKDNERNGSDR